MQGAATIGGPDGKNYKFLKYFGKFLLKEYNPKAIVVFSAHWETSNEIQGLICYLFSYESYGLREKSLILRLLWISPRDVQNHIRKQRIFNYSITSG